MLDAIPPEWLERYEKTRKVKPYELLAEYKKVEGKNYGLRMVFKFLIGLVSAVSVCLLFQHNKLHDERSGTEIVNLALVLFIGLPIWWWMNRSASKEVARLELIHQLDKIGDDIQALIDLVGGERWLNDHGIKGAMIRLAGEAVTQEKFIVKIAKKVGDGDLELVYKIQTCIGNLNSKEKAYERAINLICCFVNPPYDFERAKELAREALQIGEPDIAEEQPLT